VVVGETQPLLRVGVVHVLQESGFEVVASAANVNDLLHKTRAHSPQVAVVDIDMPADFETDGLRAAQAIRMMEPPIAVLILTQFLEDRYAIDIVSDRPEGVGYLVKDRVPDVGTFAEAVRRVAGGGTVIDPEVVRRLVSRRRTQDPIDELTPREREVLALIAEGRSNQGIADVLVVTVSAVERHVTSIFAKLKLGRSVREHRRVLAMLRYLHR
jgi:DNA-binding NarL/FixJ family response regulator